MASIGYLGCIFIIVSLILVSFASSSEVAEDKFGPSFLSLPSHSPFTSWNLASTAAGPDTKFEWSGRTIFSLILACLCALLANSAGVGGGPLYMPLFSSVLGFGVKASTALSHTVVACSGVASTCYGLWHRNPLDEETSLIDFGLALTFIPALLVGVGFGVLFNVLFPEWLQTLGLTVLLLIVIKKMSTKAVNRWRDETEKQQLGLPDQHPLLPDEEHASVPDSTATNERKRSRGSTNALEHLEDVPSWIEIHGGVKGMLIRTKNSAVPLLKIIALWAVFLALELGLAKSKRCSQHWWLYWASQTLFCVVVTGIMVHYQMNMLKKHEGDMGAGMRLVLTTGPHGGKSGISKLLQVVGIMVAAGAMAGVLGIGGALIFNPFLLALGIHPQVTASTAVMMILFSSSCISLSFAFQGLLNTSYALVFAPAAFVASSIGVTLIGRLIKVTGRASIIIFILTGLISVGTLLTVIQGSQRSYEDFKTGDNVGFRPFCFN